MGCKWVFKGEYGFSGVEPTRFKKKNSGKGVLKKEVIGPHKVFHLLWSTQQFMFYEPWWVHLIWSLSCLMKRFHFFIVVYMKIFTCPNTKGYLTPIKIMHVSRNLFMVWSSLQDKDIMIYHGYFQNKFVYGSYCNRLYWVWLWNVVKYDWMFFLLHNAIVLFIIHI